MTRAELHDLQDLLGRAARAPGIDVHVRADYEAARDLAGELAGSVDTLDERDRERLELNADLPQLAFHLAEELRAGTPQTLPGSLAFMRRHIPRLLAEFRDREHERLDPLDAELSLGLARLTRRTYDERFAARYAEAGYRRPFVDKLYRDYALTGIPGGLLLELDRLARDPEHDLVLCVLKGALAYVLLMQLLGLPESRTRHVICGRATGSHIAPHYVVEPLGFALGELEGAGLLIVDNNAASGATLEHLAGALPPARTTLWLDYVLAPLPALAQRFDAVRCGPFPSVDRAREHALKHELAARLRTAG